MLIPKALDQYKNIREFAYATIKENILNLNLQPGQKITELELVDTLQIGKTPIREALIQLAKESLINIIPQSGGFISKINFATVEEGRRIRHIIEEDVHLQAVNFMSQEDFERCRLILKQHNLIQSDAIEKHWYYDELFHQEIYQSCKRLQTFRWIQQINIDYNRIRYLALVDFPKTQTIINEHYTILEAIESKNIDTIKEVTDKHLNQVDFEKEPLLSQHQGFFVKD